MTALPPFKNGNDKIYAEYYKIFDEKLANQKKLIEKTVEQFFPGKRWDNLSEKEKEMCGHISNATMFDTMDDFRQMNPELFF
jgi:hypothetical protein